MEPVLEFILILILVGCVGFGYVLGTRRERAQHRMAQPGAGRRRPGVDTRRFEFDLRAHRPLLESHIRLVLGGFGPAIARHPPVHFPPPPHEDRMKYVKSAIRLAGRRYGTGSSEVFVRFRERGSSEAAGSVRVTPNGSFIDISNSYADSDDAVVLIAAHELAHHALHTRNVTTGSPEQDEELTDTLVVLAGYGPLMLRVYHQEFSTKVKDGIRLWISTLGYLHPTAIAYLSLIQTELAGLEPSTSLEWTNAWYVEPYRERERTRPSPTDGPQEQCHLCGSVLPTADPGTNGLTRCELCEVIQRGRHP